MKRWFLLAAFIAGLSLIGYALLYEESDEEKIRAVLLKLEESVRLDEQSNNVLLRKAQVDRAFKDIFEENVSVRIPELSNLRSGRNELALLAARAGAYYRSLEVNFSKMSIEAGNAAANVQATANLMASRGGRHERDQRSVAFRLANTEGSWRINSVTVEPTTDEILEERFER